MVSFCCEDHTEVTLRGKLLDEIPFCQLTSISKCDSTI